MNRHSPARIERPVLAKTGCEQSQQAAPLVDHLVGSQQERFRDCRPQRLGGGQVDDEIALVGCSTGISPRRTR
jgi:hypothetical protein